MDPVTALLTQPNRAGVLRAPNSLRSYRTALEVDARYLGAIMGLLSLERPEIAPEEFPWARVGAREAAALRDRLRARGYEIRTVNQRLTVLRQVMRTAWHLGQISREQFRAVDGVVNLKRAAPKRRQPVVKPEALHIDADRLLTHAGSGRIGARDRALIAFLLEGASRERLVELDLADLVTVVHGARARKALDAWLEVRGSAPGPLFYAFDASGHMTPRRVNAQTVYAALQRAVRRAGLDVKLTPRRLKLWAEEERQRRVPKPRTSWRSRTAPAAEAPAPVRASPAPVDLVRAVVEALNAAAQQIEADGHAGVADALRGLAGKISTTARKTLREVHKVILDMRRPGGVGAGVDALVDASQAIAGLLKTPKLARAKRPRSRAEPAAATAPAPDSPRVPGQPRVGRAVRSVEERREDLGLFLSVVHSLAPKSSRALIAQGRRLQEQLVKEVVSEEVLKRLDRWEREAQDLIKVESEVAQAAEAEAHRRTTPHAGEIVATKAAILELLQPAATLRSDQVELARALAQEGFVKIVGGRPVLTSKGESYLASAK